MKRLITLLILNLVVCNAWAGSDLNLLCTITNKQPSKNISLDTSITKFYVNTINQTNLTIRNSLSSSYESLKIIIMNNSTLSAKSESNCNECFYIKEVNIDRLSGDISVNQILTSNDGNGYVFMTGNCNAIEMKKPKF